MVDSGACNCVDRRPTSVKAVLDCNGHCFVLLVQRGGSDTTAGALAAHLNEERAIFGVKHRVVDVVPQRKGGLVGRVKVVQWCLQQGSRGAEGPAVIAMVIHGSGSNQVVMWYHRYDRLACGAVRCLLPLSRLLIKWERGGIK